MTSSAPFQYVCCKWNDCKQGRNTEKSNCKRRNENEKRKKQKETSWLLKQMEDNKNHKKENDLEKNVNNICVIANLSNYAVMV